MSQTGVAVQGVVEQMLVSCFLTVAFFTEGGHIWGDTFGGTLLGGHFWGDIWGGTFFLGGGGGGGDILGRGGGAFGARPFCTIHRHLR